MPVVPRIDRPPTMPSRPLSVCCASSSPPGIEISISTSPGTPSARGGLRDGGAHHGARHGIDGGLAGRDRQARPGHHADARTGAEHHACAGRAAAGPCDDERAVRHVRIVARILDDAGQAPSPPRSARMASAKAGRSPPGSSTSTGSGKLAGESAEKAAFAAAAAQVPVVQPRRSGAFRSNIVHAAPYGRARRSPSSAVREP